MIDYRKGIVAVVIAVLFTLFIQSSIDAFVEEPEYNDFCEDIEFPGPNASEEEREDFEDRREECEGEYQDAREQFEILAFLISSVFAILGIIGGLYIPVDEKVWMMVSSGILLGGLFTLFVGTIRGWESIDDVWRPFVLLGELLIVIFVAWKTLGEKSGKES